MESEVGLLADILLRRADAMATAMAEQIVREIPLYNEALPFAALRESCLRHIHSVLEPLTPRPDPAGREAREFGRARAVEGIPLSAIEAAYRVAFRFLWDEFAVEAVREGVTAEAALRIGTEIMRAADEYPREMAEGYRAEIAERARSEEQRRSALVQALLEGRLDDTNLWEAADVLSLPQSGPYVVIAARVPEIGEHALPQIQRGLHGIGIDSAWRLMHDVEIGVARLPRPADPRDPFDRLVEALAAGATSRVGVSPPYDDLRATSQALRLARIALHGALDRRGVVVFGRDPLSVAAASAPDIMPRLSRTVLAALDDLPPDDRALLLDTFGAWLDSGGSAEQTARHLFVHPNTVRYRLRRLEERTGRSLSDPRWVAELSLAYEIDRRLISPPGPGGVSGSTGAAGFTGSAGSIGSTGSAGSAASPGRPDPPVTAVREG